MPQPNEPPRKSGRFSPHRNFTGNARHDLGQKQPDYSDTAFGKRQFGNAPQKHDDLPAPKRKHYKEMSQDEQARERKLMLSAVGGCLIGFILCGLILWVIYR